MKKFLTLTAIAVAVLFSSCSKDSGGKQDAIKIQIIDNNITLNVGETKQIQVNVTPEGSYSNKMIWSSSDEKYVTVQNGVVTAVAKGESIITVLIDNAKASCRVIVKEKPVEKVTLDKEAEELEVGAKLQLTATIEPADATATVTWSSENTDFATVSDNGEVTGIAPGTTNIVATAGDKTATCKVTVVPEKLKITIDVTDITATNAKIKFTPSDKNVKFYYYVMKKDKYDKETKIGVENGEKYGIIDYDKAFAKMQAGWYGITWQEAFNDSQQAGDVDDNLWGVVGSVQPYDTEFVAYAYALDENGELVSNFVEKTFKTKSMVKSNNQITVNVLEEFINGVKAEFNVTNSSESYFISLQQCAYVDNYQGTELEMAIELVNIPYGVNRIVPTFEGNETITPETPAMSVKKKGTKYYIVYFAFDEENGVRSQVFKKEFTTKSE